MLALGCDHGGYPLMKEVIKYLEDNKIAFKNFGTYSEASVDYPEYAKRVAHAVADGECEKGILICGTGIGISISGVSSTFAPSSACKPKNANVIRHRMTVTGRRRENFVKLIILRSPRCQLLPHCLHCSLRSPQKNHWKNLWSFQQNPFHCQEGLPDLLQAHCSMS